MKKEKTQRGFEILEFKDYYKQHCSLQKSSLACVDAIWLGVNNTGELVGAETQQKNSNNNRMHLTREQVGELLPYLVGFYLKGELVKSRYLKLPKLT